jgi:hypothetical protein
MYAELGPAQNKNKKIKKICVCIKNIDLLVSSLTPESGIKKIDYLYFCILFNLHKNKNMHAKIK